MECNCNNNNSNGGVIPWVRGNRLPLIICVYENVVTQEQVGDSTLTVNEMTRVPYTIQDNDTVTVIMKSGFRQVEMPFTTDGNKVMVTDNGELPTGAYTVEVTIERGDGARGRWQETRQVRIYENTSDAQLGEMYSIDADLFFYAKGDTGTGIADITNNPDGTLTITMTDGTSYTTEALKGDKGDKGDTGERGTSIVSFDVTGQTDVSVIYTVTFSDDTTQDISVPKGPQGDTGLTGNGISTTTLNSDYTLTIAYTDGTTYTTPSIRGAQGAQGVSVIGFTQTGETPTNTMYNLVFSDGRTQSVAIPKGAKGAKGDTGNPGPQGAQGPKGDTVTATDYTLYNVQGSDSQGAMSQDATTKAISAQTGYYTCGTAEGTAEKVVTVESGNLYKRTLGGHFKVKMTNANTASGVTLQVGSETATTLWYNGAAVSASNTWDAGEVISVYYDGTNYQASNAQVGCKKKDIEEDEYVLAKRIIHDDVEIKSLKEGKLDTEELIKDEYVIAKALARSSGAGGGSGNSGILTIANSDIINVIGSSYTDGGHVLAGKNWVHRVSELSDYQYNNDGVSGTSYDSQLSGDYRANSIRYKGYCLGKYVILDNNENDGLGATKSYADWFKTLDNIVRVCTGLGIEPILATNWTQSNNFSNISLMYENYASEHNLIYMNGNDYSKTLYDATQYGLWNAGTHLGTRNQGIFSDAYLPYLQRMERPVKSMKIFRLRAGYNTSNLDILMFTDNSDRLRYFREIWCGTKACSQDSVDNHPNVYPAAGDGCPNQYEILRNGGSVSFTNAALISAVIPYTGKNTTSLQFTANITGSVNVYVKDVLATPYPATTSYTRFNVAAEDAIDTVPQTGATYSDGTTVFTVHHVVMGENGSYCTIYMNGWTDGDVAGDLQKQSGVGSDTIHYTIREYYAESAPMGDTCGHWIKIDKDGAKYNLTNIARRIMDYDKLNILIVGDSFTLSDPRVYYAGENPKALHRSKYTFVCNTDNPNSEVLQEPSFGEVGTTLSSWKDDNGNSLTSTSNYGAEHPIGGYVDLPNGLHSILVVNDVNAINTTIASDMTDVMLEIYARYFPPVYTDGSGNQITYESYDYEDLFIQFGNTGLFNSLIKKQVGVSWKIIQVPMKRIRAGKLRIYGGAKGVEIAKVSIKKIVNYETY